MVSVGAEPPAHLHVVNHVTVLLPVPSCVNSIIKHCPSVSLDIASVLLPPSVTVCMFPNDTSKVMVAPSVLAVTVCIVFLTVKLLSITTPCADVFSAMWSVLGVAVKLATPVCVNVPPIVALPLVVIVVTAINPTVSHAYSQSQEDITQYILDISNDISNSI